MKILLLQAVMRGADGGVHPPGAVLDVSAEAAARYVASGVAVLAPSEERPAEPAKPPPTPISEAAPEPAQPKPDAPKPFDREVVRSAPRAHSKKK